MRFFSRSLALLCLGVLCCLAACSSTDADSAADNRGSTPATETGTSAGTKRLMIAVVHQGVNIRDSLEGRADAALNLIAGALPQYDYVSFRERNDAIRSIESENMEPTAARIAERLDVDHLVFVRVMQLENMLRVSLTLTHAPDYLNKSEGVGYAHLRYRNEQTGRRIYDTALLQAMQRALADAVDNPSLFADVKELEPLRPAPPLVIGGIRFDEMGIQPKWNVFGDKVTMSYDMIVNVFDAIKDNPNYVAYDVDSRDSMYAFRGLYLVENYNMPTAEEMQLLEQFEVRYLISGSFVRNSQRDATLTLQLGKLDKGTYTEVASKKTTVAADDPAQVRQAVRSLALQLVE